MRRLFVFALLLLAATPCFAAEPKEGGYRIAGTDAKSGAYTGEGTLKKLDGNRWRFKGVQALTSGRQPFSGDAKLEGDKLTFTFSMGGRGLLDVFSRLFGNKKDEVTAVYTIGADGSLKGEWTKRSDGSFKRSETWTLKVIRIDSVVPGTLAAGGHRLTVTVNGQDLPSTADVDTKGVLFLLDGAEDKKIKVVALGERSDDGAHLGLVLDVDAGARLGKRGLKILTAQKDEVVTVVPGQGDLPLGGSLEVAEESTVRLHVPLPGGVLKIKAAAGAKLLDPTGKELTGDLAAGVAVATAGDHQIKLPAAGSVSNTYAIVGETRPENKPYNFWYFPFVESSYDKHRNLYGDGGVYEKVDRVFGLTPDPSATFQSYNHMDTDANFKMPTDPAEVAKYNPSTVKGYAYCYQRSTDSKKSWWGHCWGSVIASSLHRAPKAIEVATVGTSSVAAFSDEEVEGILSGYYSNHNVQGNFYVNRCPAGRPTDKAGEPVDAYAHDLWRGLVEGIKGDGVPLASNLRAEATDDESASQVWNHVVWKFEAELKRVDGQVDPTFIELAIKVYATNDIWPSDESKSPRMETWVFRLRTKDGVVVANAKDQNFVSASHFAPSYLAHFTDSSSGDGGCENLVLGGKVGIAKLTSKFGFERIR